jgi:hypothetical protein
MFSLKSEVEAAGTEAAQDFIASSMALRAENE